MATYFGQCNSDGTPSGTGSNEDTQNISWWGAYTCPGSGSQSVTDAGIYGRYVSSGSNGIRMAIYDASGASLIAQSALGSLAVGEGWGSCSFTGVTLAGGTSYIIFCFVLGSIGINSTKVGSDTVSYKLTTDYSSGFPGSVPANDGTASNLYNFRVGVDPAYPAIAWIRC